MDKVDEEIGRVVEDAVTDLQASLRVYWPTEGRNEMGEAHALGSLGRAFGRAGFNVYHEVQCRTDGRVGHVDLVAVSLPQSICVAVEGKRLYDARGAKGMLLDWQRLGVTRLASEHGRPTVTSHVRMLVSTTWQPNIREWWTGTLDVPRRRRGRSWSELRTATAGATLDGSLVQTNKDWGEQWFLCAFQERDSSLFSD